MPSIRLSRSDLGSAVKNGGGVVFATLALIIVNVQMGSLLIPIGMTLSVGIFGVLFGHRLLAFVASNKSVILYPLVVLLSTTWSSVPSVAFSGAIQLWITIIAGVIIGVATTPRQLITGIFVAMAVVVLASLISGRMGPSAAGPVLIGVTGSKDMMGFVGATLYASGLAIVFDRGRNAIYRCLALLLLMIGAYIASHVESAAPKILIVGFSLAFVSVFSLRYLPMMGRFTVVILIFFLGIATSILIYSVMSDRAGPDILQVLNKDVTLTGRTIIWEKADNWISKSPEIGFGFRSFWLGGSSDAMGLLHKFGITDPRAFEIHHTFREILVDTGWLGLAPFLITVFLFFFYVMSNVFLVPDANSSFLAATYLSLLSRTPLESIIGINSMSTILLYACGSASIGLFMSRQRARLGSCSAGPHREDNSLTAGARERAHASKATNHRMQLRR